MTERYVLSVIPVQYAPVATAHRSSTTIQEISPTAEPAGIPLTIT
ncbi:hypothetical protein ABMY60_06515 [Escherichia coli]